MAAIQLSAELDTVGRAATTEEQDVLAGWSSWGAVPAIFDTGRTEWAEQRAELRALLTDEQWSAASRTTINAHYTDPAIVAALWSAVEQLGLTEGQVLEPGCGSGTFIGMAPAGVQVTGVELDPITARIAAQLYPNAEVRAESFADTRYPAGAFDAAIGNVPFANVALHDRRHNPNGHSLHNHFILKSLDLVRPGGIVAVLTSAFTLDATNPGARREMYERADLLGAVRLPSGAHRRTAGTDALTDVLILRRREPDRTPGDDSWLSTAPVGIDGQVKRINRCYTAHSDRVLGQFTVGHGMYGADTLAVHTKDLGGTPGRLAGALDVIIAEARAAGLELTVRPDGPTVARPIATAPTDGLWLGSITRAPDRTFRVHTQTGPARLDVPAGQHSELRSLLDLRDTARNLLAAEAAAADDTPVINSLRGRLAAAWITHTDRYGPINRVTVIQTSRIDAESGDPVVQRRVPPVMRTLRTDPFASLVKALEIYDETTGTAAAAPLLSERVVLPRTPILGVDTPAESIAVAMETDGHLDLERIAHLLGVEPEQARAQLGTMVFEDPDTGALVPAPEYLSGNVRTKLAAAAAAAVAAGRQNLAANVAALREVVPADLGADEITPKIGAVWITPEDHQQFLRELIDDRQARVIYGGATAWEVKADRHSIAAASQWGTQRKPAGELLQELLGQKQIAVYDTNPTDKSRTLNATETEAAKAKAEAIADRFAEWVWQDPARADRLAGEYNRRFNCLVLRDYTAEGARLTLPGTAKTWIPLPHQRAAVARILAEPAVGLFHDVGAGKTGEMVMGAMELRRLGMAAKPVLVVPNHMLKQASREWLQIYPRARVLAASSEDLKAEHRRDFVARVATGDWDGVIMTRTAFQKLTVSGPAKADYQRRELDDAHAQLEIAKANGANLTVKRIEKKLLALEEKLDKLLDAPRDPGLSFEDTGIDYLIIDEAHDYKNLRTISSIPDANIEGSQRASDLHMKIEMLRARHGERVATLATATPIANSITEAHVMTRYLRPDLLADAGVEAFDAWAATFAQTVTELEMAPTGGGRYREKTRFASFTNVPEMLRIWSTFADVQTADDLHLPTPDLVARPDGQRVPETVTVPPTPELLDYVAQLGARADALSGRAGKGQDNMLSITGDGRRAALDMRLVGLPEPAGPAKVAAAADRIARIWRETRDNTYLDAAGAESPTRGALQLVFCDQSTPQPDRWNVYSELKSQLVDRGIPPRSVRFIHDAPGDVDKARLFAACRSGQVAVLIGSTAKMGVGTNVQTRAVALHHLDCPWRPADLAQRDGRIMRQGNQHEQVQIIRYTTGRSFDAYSWQIVERKAKFIGQVMRGRLDVREIEDIGDTALSLAETKALAADDPLILDKAKIDTQLAKLTRLDRAHHQQQSLLSHRAEQAGRTIARTHADEGAITAAIARAVSTAGDAFHASINAHTTGERTAAARALRDALLSDAARRPRVYAATDTGVRVRLGGQDFTFTRLPTLDPTRPTWRTQIVGVPRTEATLAADNIAEGIGPIRTLENRAAGLPAVLNSLHAERAQAQADEEAARAALGKPFPRAAELTAARAEHTRITALIAQRAEQAKHPATDHADQTPEPPAVPAPPPPAPRPPAAARPPARTPLRVMITCHDNPTSAPAAQTLAWAALAAGPQLQAAIAAARAAGLDELAGLAEQLREDGPPVDRGVAARKATHYADQAEQIAARVGGTLLGAATARAAASVADALRAIERAATVPGPPTFAVHDAHGRGDAVQDRNGRSVAMHHDRDAALRIVRALNDPDRNAHHDDRIQEIRARTSDRTEPRPPPDPDETARQPTAGPHIAHGRAGTVVLGTSKTDTPLRNALKTTGFKWSRQGFWYLPRPFHESTRADKIAQLQRTLTATTGRTLPVTPHPDDPRTAAPAPPAGDSAQSPATMPTPGPPAASAPAIDPQSDQPNRRWRTLFLSCPGVLSDGHWPTLADQLDRLNAAGHDIPALIEKALPGIDDAGPRPALDLDFAIADLAYLPPEPGATTHADPPARSYLPPGPATTYGPKTRPAPPR